jgi:uncharacterized membrane protein YkoI
MRHLIPIVMTTVFALGLAAAEADQSLLDLPAPVKATILREAAGRAVAAIERGEEDGRTVYYARIHQEGLDKRLTVAADGKVVAMRDFAGVNDALAKTKEAGGKALEATKDGASAAWDKTKEVSGKAWEATRDTVNKAVSSFSSDELTLNQVPAAPRAALEREAGGNRLSDIHAQEGGGKHTYRATITAADKTRTVITVADDGTVVERK